MDDYTSPEPDGARKLRYNENMLEDLKRFAGLSDDCPPDESNESLGNPGDSSGSQGYADNADSGDDLDDPPPRYCHRPPSPPIKRAVKITIGSVLLGIGLVMFITPGPALIVIPVALGILASEIPWLRRHLHALRVRIHEYRVRRKRERRAKRETKKVDKIS